MKTKDGYDIWFEKIGQNTWVHFKNENFKLENNRESKSKTIKPDSQSSSSSSHIQSSLPGRVTYVNVKVGDFVKKNQLIATLETMKIEYSFFAPKDLRVQSVLVKEGDVIERDKTIITF